MNFGKISLRLIFSWLSLAGFLYLAVDGVILPLIMQGASPALEAQVGGFRWAIALLQFVAGFCLLFQLRGGVDDNAFKSTSVHGGKEIGGALIFGVIYLTVVWIVQDLKNPRASQSRRELAVVFLPFVPLLAYKVFLSTFLFFPLLLVYIAGIAYVARECFWRLCVAQ